MSRSGLRRRGGVVIGVLFRFVRLEVDGTDLAWLSIYQGLRPSIRRTTCFFVFVFFSADHSHVRLLLTFWWCSFGPCFVKIPKGELCIFGLFGRTTYLFEGLFVARVACLSFVEVFPKPDFPGHFPGQPAKKVDPFDTL